MGLLEISGALLKAALPHNENERLDVLRSFDVLDSPRSDRFDRLTRTAARLFGTPVALVSLVDEHRQWFKSACGLDIPETDRDVAFCAHAILGDDVFIVLDTTKDPKFSDNPLVTGEPHVRFYAGAPLITPNGIKLGTFCIIDYTPRARFTDDDQAALQDLAAAAMDQLIIEKSLGDDIGVVANKNHDDVLISMNDVYGTFVKQSPTPLIMLDNEMRIVARSNRWGQLWKSRPSEDDYLSPLRSVYPNLPERWHRELERCLTAGTQSAGQEHIEITPGDERYLLWEVNRWQISDGVAGAFLNVRDETEKRLVLAEAQRSETRFQFVYQQTPAMMHSIDAHGCIIEVSNRWLKKLGYERDQVLGRRSIEFLTPASEKHAREVVLPAFFRTGECRDVAYQFVHANGDTLDVLLTASAERDAEGNIVRSVAILTDADDLNASLERFAAIDQNANQSNTTPN